MENYIVSARKYRPSTFASVVGQQALTETLKNAIATDRLAHAYLFCGSRGVGKTSCARIFAKTINCTCRTPDGEACNECPSCREFNDNRSFNIIELDAASNNGVDDIRALTEQVMVPPSEGRYRVFIIDEVHMLSSQAFNAFLKTLEEPPAHAIFILATTEKHKIIPTILSRCQIFDFNRITVGDMTAHLARVAASEGITTEAAALNVIARKADGAMRDALSIFDQVAASSRGNITYKSTIDNLNVLDHAYYSRLVDAFAAADVPAALLIYKEVRDKGFDSQFFVTGLAQYLRDLMVASNPATRRLLEADDEVREQMAAVAAKCPVSFFYTALDLLNDTDLNYRQASNKQLLVELALIKLCQRFSPSPEKSAGNGGEGQLKALKAQSGDAATATPAAQAPTQAPTAAPTTAGPQAATAHATAPKRPATPPTPAAATPPPAAGAGQRRVLKTPALSLRDEPPAQSAQAGTQNTHREKPYTAAKVEEAWRSYIQENPSAKLLCALMQTSMPRHIEDDRWMMTLTSTPQLDIMNESMPALLAHMHDRLENDAFSLQLHVDEGEPSPEIWNRSELLAHMAEDSEEFRKFIKEFKLTLD
ncbi:MAG: DNA polymerase III subunit gamma/tau [Muribaculaceae bacterium]|nr:DNA polymerase III subunit gamma/tau [Muribaculaceae bacterium]